MTHTRSSLISRAKDLGWRVQEGNRSVVFTNSLDTIVTIWENDDAIRPWTKFAGAEVFASRRHRFNAGTTDISTTSHWLAYPEAGLRDRIGAEHSYKGEDFHR